MAWITELSHFRLRLTLLLLLTIAGLSSNAYTKENNLHFSGALVAEPCVLDPETTDIRLDLGISADKYLYQNVRTFGEIFTINLLNCDVRIGNTVTMMFKGTENPSLPGLLALSTGPASGIAIGLELEGGQPLLFNQPLAGRVLSSGMTQLQLRGFVQGEPDALRMRNIRQGSFMAVTTFELSYP
ncbi:type 1 fimbria pilin [Pantoea agglomerans]|jgi:type 1 fimbria pilin|uniref:fimbrial protein n=1 Tax=Enterobacter agglomerans TaxID=549 RepID=UPI001F5B3830|nr:fimbrial protein [Pantoea agglomerans]MDQ0430955.1 type 1 fimbria pilin [Pantoea agglomerans]